MIGCARPVHGLCTLCAAVFPAFAAADEAPKIPVPSGAETRFHDVIVEDETARFRFLVAGLGSDGLTFSDMAPDFPHLCNDYAVPALAANDLRVAQVVISIADRPVPFGEADPEATQFFEGFTVSDGLCMWEQF